MIRNQVFGGLMSEKYPRIAESFKGLSIWYDSKSGMYYTNLCEHVKRDEDIKAVKAWIRKMKR
jgi:hypothetical protein